MKNSLVLLLAALMLLSMAACGGSNNEKNIIGTWALVDKETETEYGLGIEFTKDGEMRYGLTEDVLAGLTGDEDVDAALDMLMTIKYNIKSDTEMEVTVSAMFGLAKETTTVSYKLDGDSLSFDGADYQRVR